MHRRGDARGLGRAGAAAGASTDRPSTRCTIHASLKFRPGLDGGSNEFAFFKLAITISDCVGGGVSFATGANGDCAVEPLLRSHLVGRVGV
jgi:hypothetical protein